MLVKFHIVTPACLGQDPGGDGGPDQRDLGGQRWQEEHEQGKVATGKIPYSV